LDEVIKNRDLLDHEGLNVVDGSIDFVSMTKGDLEKVTENLPESILLT